jgi:tetratricopeptide (TPR) repeat protein
MRISTSITVYLFVFLILAACNNSGNRNKENTPAKSGEQEIDPLSEMNDRISKDINNDQLYIERARYYLSINEPDSAFRDIFVAIDIDDQNAGHFITLSDAWLVKGNPDKCKDALDKALAVGPENLSAYQKLAELYLIVRDYDNMHQTVNRALQLDSFNPAAYYIRGLALLEQSDTLAATDAFKMAVFQDQDFFDAYLQLGLIYSAKKDPLAIEYFNTAINLQAENILPYYNLGLFYQNNGQIQKALTNYQMILEMQPGHVNTLYNVGYINLVYVQDFETAVEYFSRVIELAPAYADAFYNRAYANEMLGKNTLAREGYKKTLEIKTNYAKAIEALNRLD